MIVRNLGLELFIVNINHSIDRDIKLTYKDIKFPFNVTREISPF